jgi:uncharacterized metal-binding protein
LSGCGSGNQARIEFLTPKFRSAELECAGRVRGQLPPGTTNGQAADRIVDIDEAGEDCRQKLARVKMKVEIYDEIVAEANAGKKRKPKR